jgi:hypothetical protein
VLAIAAARRFRRRVAAGDIDAIAVATAGENARVNRAHTFVRPCEPCTTKRPSRTASSPSSEAATQSCFGTSAKVARPAVASSVARDMRARTAASSGGRPKNTSTSQGAPDQVGAAPGVSKAAAAVSAGSNASTTISTTRRAVASSQSSRMTCAAPLGGRPSSTAENQHVSSCLGCPKRGSLLTGPKHTEYVFTEVCVNAT